MPLASSRLPMRDVRRRGGSGRVPQRQVPDKAQPSRCVRPQCPAVLSRPQLHIHGQLPGELTTFIHFSYF